MISDMIIKVFNDKIGKFCIAVCYHEFDKFKINDIVFVERHETHVLLGEEDEVKCDWRKFVNNFTTICKGPESISFNLLKEMVKGYSIISLLSTDTLNINFKVGDDKINIHYNGGDYTVTRTVRDTPNVAHCDSIIDVLVFFETMYQEELKAGKVLRTEYTTTAIQEFARQNQLKLAICKGAGFNFGYAAGTIVAYDFIEAGSRSERVRLYCNLNMESYEDLNLSGFEELFIPINKGMFLHQGYVTTIINGIFENNIFNSYTTSICTFYNIACGNKRVSIHLDRFGFNNPQARVFISTCAGDEEMKKCTDLHDLVILLSNIKEDEER